MSAVLERRDHTKIIHKLLNHKNSFNHSIIPSLTYNSFFGQLSALVAIILALTSLSATATPRYQYADPSSYAISLYGVNADTLESVAKNPSGFLQFTKDGTVAWKATARMFAGSGELQKPCKRTEKG
jgi:hypothetical protein